MAAHSSSANLSAAEHVRLNSFLVDIAAEARGKEIADGAGNYRFGSSRRGLCVYANGQYHDFAGGARAHGFSAFELIQHLYPNEDPSAWARDWLARCHGTGSFVAGDGETVDDFAETEATAYVETLYNGAAPIDDTPGYTYIAQARGLSLRPEDQAQLRWIADYRGDEGALLHPVTDDDGKFVKLFVTHVTSEGRKSPYTINRTTIRGARRPGLYRLGEPGPDVVETEGPEKAWAARAAGAPYVVVCGGVNSFGKIPLPQIARSVVIARDADPVGSPADQDLYRGVVRRLGQNLKVGVTARPNDIAPKDAPPLKDLDDVHRYDDGYVDILLKGANLEHGRLGAATENAIFEEASRLLPGELSHARKSLASLLGISRVALDDEIEMRVRARIAAKQAVADLGEDGRAGQPLTYPPLDPWPDPVNGAELLSEMSDALSLFVRLTKGQADALALCIVHGHAFDCFDIMPIGVITSPQMRSGKTRLMRLLARTAPKALLISNANAAFLTRAIDRDHPNVFADEFDAAIKGDPEKAEMIRGIVNALFDREGSFIGKCVPTEDGHEPRRFSVWGPLWIAGIKRVPPTIEDRAVHIELQRKLPGEKVQRLRRKDGPEFDVFRRKAARFVIDNERALRDADPDCPASLSEYSDRAADAWSPLFAIAQVAGGDWLARAHKAALALTVLQDDGEAENRVGSERDDELALLADTQTVLLALDEAAPDVDELRKDKQIARNALTAQRARADAGQPSAKPPRITPAIGGEQLANALGATDLFPDRRWSEWAHGRPIKSHHIISVLREYGIVTKSVRAPGVDKYLWGFSRAALDNAFSRYVFSSGGIPTWGPKSVSHPHNIENVEENVKNANSSRSAKSAPETPGDPSNSASFVGEGGEKPTQETDSHVARVETLTRENSPSENSIRPHDESVNIPRGATRRRGIGGLA